MYYKNKYFIQNTINTKAKNILTSQYIFVCQYKPKTYNEKNHHLFVTVIYNYKYICPVLFDNRKKRSHGICKTQNEKYVLKRNDRTNDNDRFLCKRRQQLL